MTSAQGQEQVNGILIVGGLYSDTILHVPSFPKEDSKQIASKVETRRGGNAANTITVLGQLLHNKNYSHIQQGDHVKLYTGLVSCLSGEWNDQIGYQGEQDSK